MIIEYLWLFLESNADNDEMDVNVIKFSFYIKCITKH